LHASRRLTVVTETHESQYEMQLLVSSAPITAADAANPPRQQDEVSSS